MPVDNHQLRTFGVGVTAAYLRGLQGGTAPLYSMFTTPFDMPTETVEAPIAGVIGPLRKWKGARVIQHVSNQSYKVTAEKFEKTIAIDRDSVERDNLGLYRPSIEQLGLQTLRWPDQQTFAKLEANGTDTIDGVAFFSTTHQERGANVANFTNGANPAWYLMDTSQPLKPMAFGTFVAPEITPRLNPDDPHVFDYDEYIWGVRCKGVACYGLWQMAYKHKGTLDAANFEAAITAMRSRVDESGESLDINPNLLVVSRDNEFAAKRLFAEYLASGATNIHASSMKYVVAPRLTGV